VKTTMLLTRAASFSRSVGVNRKCNPSNGLGGAAAPHDAVRSDCSMASPISGDAPAGKVPTTITVVLASPPTSIHLITSAAGVF
jgi:hypothetical protein